MVAVEIHFVVPCSEEGEGFHIIFRKVQKFGNGRQNVPFVAGYLSINRRKLDQFEVEIKLLSKKKFLIDGLTNILQLLVEPTGIVLFFLNVIGPLFQNFQKAGHRPSGKVMP